MMFFRRWWRCWMAAEPVAEHDPTETARAVLDEGEKAEIQRRLHDAESRLHVMEWQADVEMRRRRTPS